MLDFQAIGISLGDHPMSVLKTEREKKGALDSQALKSLKNNQRTRHAGMVVSRQMPPTANGVLFVTLEDECGLSNLIFWKDVAKQYEEIIWKHSFYFVEGTIQKDAKSEIVHLIVNSLQPFAPN